jgi:hypothetical protein
MICTLVDTLARGGKPSEIWTSPDGSTILVLPHGGRILALAAPGSGRNFFWTHPALESIDSLGTFYQSTAWHNSGGDRTWLSPEVDFFLPRFPELDTYVQPRELDPGNYQLTRENDGITLTNRFSLELSRSKHTADFMIRKRLGAAQNPLRHDECAGRLMYAGFTLRTRLEFTNRRATPLQVSLWSLLQLPHGGELLIPTFSRSTVTPYFGNVDEDDLLITEHLIRYRMRSAGNHKLGFQTPAVTGRAGYLYAEGMDSCLVIRNFFVNPSGDYPDIPSTSACQVGSAIEGCSVNGDLVKFSELEYHTPAIGGSEGDFACDDESQVWAFRGKERDIMEAAHILLSSEI